MASIEVSQYLTQEESLEAWDNFIVPMSNKENVMTDIRMAYLLVAHKCPEQVNIFVKQLLDYADCDIYIHVDKKKPEMVDQLLKHERVFVCSIYDVRWGSFEIVKAAYHLMAFARESGKTYTHFYFGSGQDLLVRKGLYEYLAKKPDKIFLRINREITNNDRASSRHRVCWPKKLMIRNDLHIYRFVRIAIQFLCRIGIVLYPNKVQLKKKIRFYEGRTWFIAPIRVMDYILEYIKSNPDYVAYWEDSLAADLMFFQTIIMNSPYAGEIEEELMYVEFGQTFRTMNHPLTITMNTVKRIESGNYYCARKFEWNEKDTIEYYLEKTRNEKI